MQVEEYIVQLLKTNSCVVVPGFGAFISNYSSAQINDLTNHFTPPSSAISFNPSVNNDDGLLLQSISQSEKIEYSAAKTQISEYIGLLLETLNNGEAIDLIGLGVLYMNASHKVCFEPDVQDNLNIESFGLPKFHFNKLPLIKESEEKETAVIINIDRSSFAVFKRIAAVFTLAVFVYFMLIWLNNNRIISSKTLASINPFHNSYSIHYLPRKDNSPVVYEDLMELSKIDSSKVNSTNLGFIEIESDVSNTQAAILWNKIIPNKIDSTRVVQNFRPKASQFYIIAGVFGDFENAQKLIHDLNNQGFNASYMNTSNGMFRVSYNAYGYKMDAIKDLIQIKKSNPKAWIYSNS
jgi:nucleoid DNA-binding protein